MAPDSAHPAARTKNAFRMTCPLKIDWKLNTWLPKRCQLHAALRALSQAGNWARLRCSTLRRTLIAVTKRDQSVRWESGADTARSPTFNRCRMRRSGTRQKKCGETLFLRTFGATIYIDGGGHAGCHRRLIRERDSGVSTSRMPRALFVANL
jgi:hypothetical protein